MQEMSKIKAVHRDIKNANILLHFPKYPDELPNKHIAKELKEHMV